MSFKYEILKRLVKAANIKKRWLSVSTEELLENRRQQNAKNRIPNLSDDAFDVRQTAVNGFPVLQLLHKKRTDRANLFMPKRACRSSCAAITMKKRLPSSGRRYSFSIVNT